MLNFERINKIKELLYQNKKIEVSSLCKLFDVSEVTIRKDLARLEQEGLIKKIYGGAVLNEKPHNLSLSPSDSAYDEHIQKIAALALGCIDDGDSIFLGSGRTCCQLAKLLDQVDNISVITNNISALPDLYQNVAKVFLIGGEVTSVDNKTIFSSIADPKIYLENVFVAKSFTSASGIDLQAGVTVNSIISTHIYKCLPAINRKWYLMLDSSKFDRTGFYKVAELDDLDSVIANEIPVKYGKVFQEKKIKTLTLDQKMTPGGS